MAQQINLCKPILLTQKRYFSALAMVQALALFVILGAGLCAYWVWNLNVASDGFKETLATQARELEALQAAIKQGKLGTGSLETTLTKELPGQKTQLQQRQSLMEELQRGLFRPGWGHAARLQLVAQSIPAQVWVTDLQADDTQLELSGFTLEPAALNDWMSKLAASPLLAGQKLSTVKVQNASAAVQKSWAGGNATVTALAAVAALPAVSSVVPVPPRPMWSFNLVNTLAKPALAAGAKP